MDVNFHLWQKLKKQKENKVQNKVKKFNIKVKKFHKTIMPLSSRLLDVQSEIGELNKEYLKLSRYGTKNFIKNDDFKMEFGDVLYSLLSLAEEAKINADECLQISLNKMEKRLETKQNLSSGK